MLSGLPIIYHSLKEPEQITIETCDEQGVRPPRYECDSSNKCGLNAQCILDNSFKENCICLSGFEFRDFECVDIDECANGTHECGDAPCFNLEGTYRCTRTVDVVWAVDGTGSYKGNVETAQQNFIKQRDYFMAQNPEETGSILNRKKIELFDFVENKH